MDFIRLKADGAGWTALGTDGAADAFFRHNIFYEGNAFAGRTNTVNVGFKFFPEIPEGGKDRIGRSFSQTAQASLFCAVGKRFKLNKVMFICLSVADLFQQVKHTARADPAKCAFPAGLILRKGEKIVSDIHHAIGFIKDDQSAGTHHGARTGQCFKIHGEIAKGSRQAAA